MRSILLVPVSPAPTGSLNFLQHQIASILHGTVSCSPGPPQDLPQTFDSSRNQFYSTAILASLLRQFPTHEGKILAVTSGDLFVPVLTYVFGEAQLNGTAAVISSCRLDDQLYGLPANRSLFDLRLVKEAVHELGHTFGLMHCHEWECVMRSSTSVEDIDTKSDQFCPSCSSLLNNGE